MPLDARLLEPFLYGWIALALVVAVVLLFVTAPYGRHLRAGWGPSISPTLAWVLMEAPSPLLFLACFLAGSRRDAAAFAFLGMWLVHYVNRAFVFPFRRRGGGRSMPLAIALQAVFFNCVNAITCGVWLFSVAAKREGWLGDPRFVAGVVLFALGLAVNVHSDEIVFRLRRPGESGYRVPEGGLFRFVSAPNYLGEIVEWWGFALATWALAPVAFAVWTTANLLPRALANHRWYRERFPDYPRDRRAVIPFVL